jgi:peptidyl-prolyl cis-trans isomerase SurA
LVRLRTEPTKTPEELIEIADAIADMLAAGEGFDEIARDFSEDSRAATGGDWGWIAQQDLRPELGEVAFALDPDEISEPILLERDVFILKVEGKRAAGVQPLAEVREQIEDHLRNKAAWDNYESWIEGLRRSARIRMIDPPSETG